MSMTGVYAAVLVEGAVRAGDKPRTAELSRSYQEVLCR